MSLRTSRRTILVATLAAALAGSVAFFAPTASASNVGWSVSVGGPGFAMSAGQPGYWNGYRSYRVGYGYGYPHYRPWHRPVAPVVYSPLVYPYAYVAPRVYVAPRPVYVRPPVVGYYGYGR